MTLLDLAPGIYPDLAAAYYFALQAESRSDLLALSRSPAFYRWLKEHPKAATDAMDLGTAIHCAILEPERFAREYAFGPRVDLRTKDGKAEWAAFLEAHPGAVVLRDGDAETVRGIAEAVRANGYVRPLLQGPGESEVTAVCRDEATGIALKARLDRRFLDRHGRRIILDLKSAVDSSEEAFTREVAKRKHHVQGAFYCDVHQAASGEDREHVFLFVVYATEPPYAPAVYPLDAEAINTGREEYRRMLRLLAWCRENNRWPDGTRQARSIGLPAYYRPFDETRFMEN